MAYRNLLIENATEISAANGQLIVVRDDRYALPIEDINSILLENRFTKITTHALSELAKGNVTVYVCDEKHLPCAVMTPFMQNVRSTAVVKCQNALTIPAKKRLWQQVAKAKIINQSLCLGLLGYVSDSHYLRNLANDVNSGDTLNVEATAANYYFKVLFGKGFTREDDNTFNAALNYGYAIMRGNMAKLVAVYGLIPLLGIHHNSTVNSFNLVDDLMEPFRPVVDLFVAKNVQDNMVMNGELKRCLYNLLNVDMEMGNLHYTVAYAEERMVQSYLRCIEGKSKEMLIPVLMELRQHSYE